MTEQRFGDPLTYAYWEAAARHELTIQQCTACGHHQFYPRPFCLQCSGEVEWVTAAGTGTVYSSTTVCLSEPHYTVALVDLDEGPRLLTALEGEPLPQIGDRVSVAWRERDEAPPIPVFRGL